jgi:hypothetical protein
MAFLLDCSSKDMDKRWGGKQTKVEAHGQGLVLPGHARDVDDGTEKGTGPPAARPGGCATRSSIEKLRQTRGACVAGRRHAPRMRRDPAATEEMEGRCRRSACKRRDPAATEARAVVLVVGAFVPLPP